jgi:hypothetical protein
VPSPARGTFEIRVDEPAEIRGKADFGWTTIFTTITVFTTITILAVIRKFAANGRIPQVDRKLGGFEMVHQLPQEPLAPVLKEKCNISQFSHLVKLRCLYPLDLNTRSTITAVGSELWRSTCNLSCHPTPVKVDRPLLAFAAKIAYSGKGLGTQGSVNTEGCAPMACRIESQVIGEGLLMLCISGRIADRDVDTLRALVELEEGVVAIDLTNVLMVGREVIKFLAIRESYGVELRNCPPYIREWVTREAAEQGDERTGAEDNDA